MLRLDYPEIAVGQISIVEQLLPPEILKLPADLEKVDQILNDERFEEPFIERFNVTIGRGSIPVLSRNQNFIFDPWGFYRKIIFQETLLIAFNDVMFPDYSYNQRWY